MMDFDQQLAQLLGSMTLQNTWNVVPDVVSASDLGDDVCDP